MDTTTANALANEARRQELRARVARLQGNAETQASLAAMLGQANNDTIRRLQSAQTELAALEAGAGPGITDAFGAYSAIDQVLRQERFAGKAASVDFIKANPTCTEQQALDAWQAAGLAATGLPALLQDHALLAQLYQRNLLAAGFTSEATWEAQRAWIVATEKSVIMGA